MTVGETETDGAPCRGRHGGFTLVELLVGLTLLSIMALILYGAFWLGVRSWHGAHARHEDIEDIRLTVDFLTSYLIKACPLLRQEDAEQRLQFEGDEYRLRFVADMGAHLGTAGFYTVVLEIVANGEQRELVATRALLHPDIDPLETDVGQVVQRAVLVRHLEEAHFEYFGPLEPGDSSTNKTGDQWQPQWTESQRLPTLVSLEVTPTTGTPWPRLVFRLRVNGIRRDTSRFEHDEARGLMGPDLTGHSFPRPPTGGALAPE